MQINQAGLDLIKKFEGLRLQAYQDVAGIWTIGYGHIKTVKAGMTITAEQAEQLLKDDLKDAESAVQNAIKVAANDNEFSALVSLVFNIGKGAFSKSSTLQLLNKDQRVPAADAIELWNKSTIGGKKEVVPGLVARRAAEKGLFLTPTAESLLASATAPAPAATVPAPKAPAPSAKAPAAKSAAKGAVAAKTAADTGPDSRAKPIESSRTRRDNLAGSRTVQGAAATAATGAATVGTGVTGQNPVSNPQVQHALTYVHAHGNEILVLVGIVIVVASLWILAARIDDWSRGYR